MALFLAGPLTQTPLKEFICCGAPTTRAALPKATLFCGHVPGMVFVGSGPENLWGETTEGPTDISARLRCLGLETRQAVTVDGAPVQVLTTAKGQTALFDPTRWQEVFAPLFNAAMEELIQRVEMGETGTAPPLMMPLSRAAGRLRAESLAPDPNHFARSDVQVLERRSVHRGFFGLDKLRMAFPKLADGAISKIEREVFLGTDAALVLPYDPVQDSVLLVEQLRTGPVVRGDPNPWMLEPVAGLVDAGETPETTAIRESQEEAGLEIQALEKVGSTFPSPGLSTEFFHLFIGIADFTKLREASGLDAEGEDIKSHVIPASEFFDRAKSGKIDVLPLLTLALWLEQHRDRLRLGH